MYDFDFPHGLFDKKAISGEVMDINSRIEKSVNSGPKLWEATPEEARAYEAANFQSTPWCSPQPNTETYTFKSLDDQDLECRVYRPNKGEAAGIYLHIHGGGFVIGGAKYQDEKLLTIASEANCVVVSVEYRLAPEFPFPYPVNDCEAAALWILDHSKDLFGLERFVIGGESAGACLVVATLVRLQQRGLASRFLGALLNYGWFDIGLTPSARLWGDRNLIVNTKGMEWFRKHYTSEDHYKNPEVSPLYANLADLPPALFNIGTLDPILDDTLFMHSRWAAAGNEAHLKIYQGAPHCMEYHGGPHGDRFRQVYFKFIRDTLDRPLYI